MKGFWFLIIIAVFLSGCSKEENLPEAGSRVPLSVSSASLSAVFTKSTPSLLNSGKIGLFLLSSNGYTAMNDVEYDYGSPAWIPQSSTIYLNNNNASVCAYYPWGAAGITSSSDPTIVPLTAQIYSDAQDLCFVSKNLTSLNNSSPSIDLTMGHAYSRITFTIDKDATTYKGNCQINYINISNPGIMKNNTLDITSGTYGSTTPNGSCYYDPGISGIFSSSVSTSVLMVPAIMSGSEVKLMFVVDGSILRTSLPTSTIDKLKAGSEYSIHVTVKGTALIIDSVNITDWAAADGSGVIL